MSRRLFRALPLVLFAAPAFAQSEPSDTPEAPRRVLYQKETHIDFTDVELNVPVNKPDLVYTLGNAERVHIPLIRVREDFLPEMTESVDDVR